MNHCRWPIMFLGVLALGAGVAPSPAQPPPGKAPDVTGAWTGIWGPYNPAQSGTLAKEKCKALDCRVTQKDGVSQATSEGECGRPDKFVIKRESDVVVYGTRRRDNPQLMRRACGTPAAFGRRV
jgi:hypothetical protein